MEHDEAGESNFLYFEGLKIYQAENGFFRMTRHFSTFREDPDREKVFNVVPEFIVLLKKSVSEYSSSPSKIHFLGVWLVS